jgi:hypothetical protein
MTPLICGSKEPLRVEGTLSGAVCSLFLRLIES